MATRHSQHSILLLVLPVLVLLSCGADEAAFDAQGVFEADEVIVSTEVGGKITWFDVEEGDVLEANQPVGAIDSTQLVLQKATLYAQIRALLSQTPDVATQIASLGEQIAAAKRESKRIEPLVDVGGLPSKQLDDARTQVGVLEKQLAALQSSLEITRKGLKAQTEPLTAQIAQVNDQIARCTIVNPIAGTVLATYAKESEVTGPGKAMYKVANLSRLTLRAYVDGTQFSRIRLGDSVLVFVDDGTEGYREIEGQITWITDEAEFTPKTIQTKDERANLVYAVKIAVPNDGRLKVGMYGEVQF